MARYVLALDQGTTSSRAILFDHDGRVVACRPARVPADLSRARPGWSMIRRTSGPARSASRRRSCRKQARSPADIAAIGITNQRETTIVWDKATGRPIHNAIVWQDRRTAPLCDDLNAPRAGSRRFARRPAWSSTPTSPARRSSGCSTTSPARASEPSAASCSSARSTPSCIWRLTGGAVHVTDYSNASRTLLFNIHTLDWDDEILRELRIPRAMLPTCRPSSEVYGETEASLFGAPIPIAGDAGDQQAATFGQACFAPGMAKNTYGTGCFLLLNTGEQAASLDATAC